MTRACLVATMCLLVSGSGFEIHKIQIPGGVATLAGQGGSYLPLTVGAKWVLRNARERQPVVFEVLERDGDGYRLRSTNPWGSSEWTLVDDGGKFVMIAYGTGGPMMPLPQRPLYLDFTGRAGSKWSNQLGELSVTGRNVAVKAGNDTYSDTVRIRHKTGTELLFTFARRVGFVQFGDGNSAFVLDKEASTLPGDSREAAAAASDPRPAPRTAAPRASVVGPRRAGAPVLIGLTPNKFANEPLTVEVMTRRVRQTLDAGVDYIVGNDDFKNLERSPGNYDLYNPTQLASIARDANIPIYYTLRVINTVARDVPKDLERVSWDDRRMRDRVLRLVEAVAPVIKDHAKWFTFGYEIDGYLAKHPREAAGFIELHRLATRRMKELIPGIEVSSTLTFATGLAELDGRLARLNQQLDFLAVTYAPLKANLTVNDPTMLPADFARMREVAKGRKVLLQEIAYPSSADAGGSEDKQAQFYELAFAELARNADVFEAANFMMLADLSDEQAAQFAAFYGMKGDRAFTALIQTLGMFDVRGRPKKGWQVFQKHVGR